MLVFARRSARRALRSAHGAPERLRSAQSSLNRCDVRLSSCSSSDVEPLRIASSAGGQEEQRSAEHEQASHEEDSPSCPRRARSPAAPAYELGGRRSGSVQLWRRLSGNRLAALRAQRADLRLEVLTAATKVAQPTKPPSSLRRMRCHPAHAMAAVDDRPGRRQPGDGVGVDVAAGAPPVGGVARVEEVNLHGSLRRP